MRRLKATFMVLAAVALAAAACGCTARRPDPTAAAAPPPDYLRRITVVLERSDFRPVAGAELTIETDPPTRLARPAGGRGRTNGQGALELVFEPQPHYDQAALAGGDVIVDYPISAKIVIRRPGRPAAEVRLTDNQTFARYGDPLYQGLDREPEGDSYFTVVVP